MKKFALAFAVPAFVLAFISETAMADPKDYRFEAVQSHVKAATDSLVTVRLVHVPDSKPVPGAVIFNTKMEMPMEGMAPMTAKVAAVASSTAGEYPFRSDLSIDGSWVLSLFRQGTGGKRHCHRFRPLHGGSARFPAGGWVDGGPFRA